MSSEQFYDAGVNFIAARALIPLPSLCCRAGVDASKNGHSISPALTFTQQQPAAAVHLIEMLKSKEDVTRNIVWPSAVAVMARPFFTVINILRCTILTQDIDSNLIQSQT
jgi:hypothetical protein